MTARTTFFTFSKGWIPASSRDIVCEQAAD
jgi:hypothetical protein